MGGGIQTRTGGGPIERRATERRPPTSFEADHIVARGLTALGSLLPPLAALSFGQSTRGLNWSTEGGQVSFSRWLKCAPNGARNDREDFFEKKAYVQAGQETPARVFAFFRIVALTKSAKIRIL